MGTKWCTTQENHWNDYISNYKLIYIINKLSNEKYAISRDKRSDSKILAWLSDDKETSPFMLPLPPNIMSIITEEVRKKECVRDLMWGISDEIKEDVYDVMKYIQGLYGSYVVNSSNNNLPDSYL
jgi:hypothetical protein